MYYQPGEDDYEDIKYPLTLSTKSNTQKKMYFNDLFMRES